jgi:hypothetical protein
VDLVPFGKKLNLNVRRTQLAKEEVWKLALRAPKRYLFYFVFSTTSRILDVLKFGVLCDISIFYMFVLLNKLILFAAQRQR